MDSHVFWIVRAFNERFEFHQKLHSADKCPDRCLVCDYFERNEQALAIIAKQGGVLS